MISKKFSKERLQILAMYEGDDTTEEAGYKVIYQNLTGKTRGSLVYEMVFKYDGKFYATSYRTGATENQYEEPYEYEDDEIVCIEVHPVEKTITMYEVVK